MGSDRPTKRPSALLALSALVLLAIGFASSVYLTNLYVEVTKAMGGGTVDSFCNLSEGVNCESVAASEYSAFLGIPISVYGVEYFGVAIALLVAAYYRLLPIKRWDSLLFALSCAGVPATIILGWISVTIIQSVCIMCLTVYAANTLLVVLLAIPNRARLRAFAGEGLREFADFALDERRRAASVIITLLVLSQFVWIPRIMGREAQTANPSKPPASVENAKVGTWLDLPASRNSLGPVNAAIQIEEFTDFQCPFCGRAHEVMLEVVKKYPGSIRLVHRDFPLDHNCNPGIQEPFHPDACGAAFFARCAADQDLYWPFETMLFRNQRKLKKAAMLSFAATVGLDTDKMSACVVAKATHQAVLADIEEGIKRGVSGTPTFFVNGEAIVGARPVEFWDEKIQSLLGGGPATSAPAATPPPASGSAEPAAPAAASNSAQ